MISPQHFAARWGAGRAQATSEAASTLPVPEEARAFLVQAGLPATADPGLAFDLSAASFPTLRRAAGARGRGLPADADSLWRIGSRGDTHLCLDAAGRVVNAGTESSFWAALVNSSVPQLAESLPAFRAVMASLHAQEEQDMKAAAAAMAGSAMNEAPRAPLHDPQELARRHREEKNALTDGLRWLLAELRRIDPEAMEEGDTFWPPTLEDMAEMRGIDWAQLSS